MFAVALRCLINLRDPVGPRAEQHASGFDTNVSVKPK